MARPFAVRVVLGLVLLGTGALCASPEAFGQTLGIGGHVVANMDIQKDVTWAVGGRAHVGLPFIGVGIQVTYDFYLPECGTLECDLDELGVNLRWSLPVPYLLDPYLGVGLAFQQWERQGPGEDGAPDSDTGVNFIAGLVLQGPTFDRFQPFAEFKYQIWDDYVNQATLGGGILLRIL